MDTPCTRLRLRFAKRGDLRLVSHHDLMRCLERALRRAAIPVAQTQGFNPRPRVSFPLALALGIEGRREVVELELADPLPPAEVLGRLSAVAPPGLDFFEVEPAAPRAGRVEAAEYLLDLPEGRREAAAEAIARLLAADRLPIVRRRPDRSVELDLRPFVLEAGLRPDGSLRLLLKIDPGGSARPEEVLEAIGLRDLLASGAVLARSDVRLAPA